MTDILLSGQFGDLISFFSVIYLLVFLPVVIMMFTVFPGKSKPYVLLFASYIFYFLVCRWLIGYLIASTISVYVWGVILGRFHNRRDAELERLKAEKEAGKADIKLLKKEIKKKYQKKLRVVMWLGVLTHIGLLLVIKYSGFFAENINALLSGLGVGASVTVFKFLMPLGISFFTMQAVGYIVDVYRGTIKADKNFGRIALFMGFFPQIVEGPICRWSQTAEVLWNTRRIEYKNLTFGIQRILYGMFKKVIIADRLHPIVEEILLGRTGYHGGLLFIGAIGYTIELYMDFSGTIDAVIGTAEIFGVKMPENFRQPLFSRNITEFWKRWHITLGAWFKDYIFYPVTLTNPMKRLAGWGKKKIGNYYGPMLSIAVALFCVWFSNGLWHGAAWSFIFYGMYHFFLILLENIFEPPCQKLNKKLHINKDAVWFKGFQILRTLILIFIGEMFFYEESLANGIGVFKTIITDFSVAPGIMHVVKYVKSDVYDLWAIGIGLLVVLVISILKERGINIRESLSRRNIVLRWAILYALILAIIIFGAYGNGYIAIDPMYANF